MSASERATRERGRLADASIVRVRAAVAAGLEALEADRDQINALDAGDGDTGDNMALTQRAVLEELDRLAALRESGVLDAGGYGIVVLVAGIARALSGDGCHAESGAHRPESSSS
ncbi:MAG TPA: hypothetical protein VMF07_12765 [Solirubrobacteraceae bacterium]|nr:hypothetical protein [Solirubrobacteraceae bacterium]